VNKAKTREIFPAFVEHTGARERQEINKRNRQKGLCVLAFERNIVGEMTENHSEWGRAMKMEWVRKVTFKLKCKE
jgi:hypothetical protein